MLKICRKCKTLKSSNEFHKAKMWADGLQPYCKQCRKEAAQSPNGKLKARLRNKKSYHKNIEKRRIAAAIFRSENKAKLKEYRAKFFEKHPEKWKENCLKYRTTKKRQTPKWVDLEHKLKLKAFYENCPKGFHVDHIVPLRGANVSGLNVIWNLQYLPEIENLKKGNKT